MWRARSSVNGQLLATILLLVGFGFVIFLSASVGLVARENGATFNSTVFSQLMLGLIPGLVFMYLLSRMPLRILRRFAFYLFVASLLFCLLVFIPQFGFAHGGAHRWISVGSHTFQPSEVLKIAAIIYLAAWFSVRNRRANTVRGGVMPFLIVMAFVGAVLLTEPDIDTFLVIFMSCAAMYIVAGARFRHVALLAVIGIALIGLLAWMFPYVHSRLSTFLNPAHDTLGAGYQINQSLIAVGSGGLLGKGFGKSTQKFNYLPEPTGDSIYAVESEEFGLIGSVGLLLLFFALAHQGLRIASRAHDPFGRYVAVGITVMFFTQAFVNVGAMLALLPLSGITLPFVSHGGSALLFALIDAGILLSISRTVRA